MRVKMAEKQRSQSQRGRAWTETELAYFAIVLADEKNEFAVRLDTLALKKTANNNLFTEISEAFQECLLSEEFKLENEQEISRRYKGKRVLPPLQITPAKLRVKYKWLRSEWRKYTDRVKKGSGKEPINEPKWFNILNPIFADTLGDINDVASSSSDVLNENEQSDDCSSSNDELDVSSATVNDNFDLGEKTLEENISSSSSSSNGNKRKSTKPALVAKPCLRKKVKSQTQAIHEIAKSFNKLGGMQQKRSDMMAAMEKERQSAFLNFQREQAELNRKHELEMLKLMMQFNTNPAQPVGMANTFAQQPMYYNTSMAQPSSIQFQPSHTTADSRASNLIDLDHSSNSNWHYN